MKNSHLPVFSVFLKISDYGKKHKNFLCTKTKRLENVEISMFIALFKSEIIAENEPKFGVLRHFYIFCQ